MDVQNELKNYKIDIEAILQNYFSELTLSQKSKSKFYNDFIDELSEYTLRGGKRLRPALMYYTYLLFSQENLDVVKDTSIYLELLQSFLLIHDDIMDRSKIRRGEATMHKHYEKYSTDHELNDDTHFGNTMGILSGDLACQLAYQVINTAKVSDKIRVEVSKLLSEELIEIVYGQTQDILLNYAESFKYDDVITIQKYKTARYTFLLPIFSGAILAGKDKAELNSLYCYAMNCGIAFQIRDDILGVFGDDEVTGKESTSDIIEGKKTLLVLKAYEKATPIQKVRLDHVYSKRSIRMRDLKQVRKIMKDTGSLKFSLDLCTEYAKKGKSYLGNIDTENNNLGVEFLSGIADELINIEI